MTEAFRFSYASPMDVDTYRLMGLDKPAPWEVNGYGRYSGLDHESFDAGYSPCAEASPPGDAPQGEVVALKDWQDSGIYPDTRRDLRFYTTPGLAAGEQDINLMIFNDGIGYLARSGPVRASLVLDSLHAAGEIGPTLAIFINAGRPRHLPDSLETQAQRNEADEQRSIEYDSLRPDYAGFLLREIIPLAEDATGCNVTEDPSRRLLAGISSGGICAFTAAWHHPEMFGRVMSHCGSFVNIKGGHNYAALVRTTPRKPIRVFMQSGENDIDGIFGNWPLGNQMMAQSLDFAGYDVRFEYGVGGHTLAHGGAVFADSLRWLLR